MKFSRVHKSLSKTGETQQQSSQFAPRPFGIQAKNESITAKTQEDIENQTFAQQKMEATKLEIQAKFGSITPEGQERLDVLQAQMNGLLLSRVKTASQFGHNIANISPKRLDTPAPVQAKLTIGEPGDKYEQEADETARQVVQRIHQPQSEKLQRESLPQEEEELQMKPEGSIQRESLPEEDELQMKPMVQRVSDGGIAASPDLETSIQQARGGGQPLPESVREPMEREFGADFSGVKLHTDSQSDQLNQSIQAKAFTTGQDVFFRQGEYNPGSRGGQELLAHELTHVVQQNGAAVQRTMSAVVQRMKADGTDYENSEKRKAIEYAKKEVKKKNPKDSDYAQQMSTYLTTQCGGLATNYKTPKVLETACKEWIKKPSMVDDPAPAAPVRTPLVSPTINYDSGHGDLHFISEPNKKKAAWTLDKDTALALMEGEINKHLTALGINSSGHEDTNGWSAFYITAQHNKEVGKYAGEKIKNQFPTTDYFTIQLQVNYNDNEISYHGFPDEKIQGKPLGCSINKSGEKL